MPHYLTVTHYTYSMKPLLILAICAFSFSFALAQGPGKSISGSIKDIQNQPLAGATVTLLRAKDSSSIGSKAAKENGRFEFGNLSNEQYLLSISAVGHKKYFSSILTIDDKRTSIQLPAVIMVPLKNNMLKEAVVVAKKPLIEQDIDKTIVNVEAMITAATSNALEVLEKTPGITVGTDGEINLNNRSVLVLIDGRPTYMSGQELAAYLRSLPGGMIDKIELMMNPPAKYDAAGGSVVNIRLKKSKIQGYTGSINMGYSQGFTGRFNSSLNLNYLRRKVNVFANMGYTKDGNYIVDEFDRTLFNSSNQVLSSVSLRNALSHLGYGGNIRTGIDYTLSSKTTIGVILSYNDRPRKENVNYISKTYNGNGVLDSVGTGNTHNEFRWRQSTANFNFQHKIDSTGKEITADINYITYKTTGDQLLTNFVDASERDGYLYDLPSDVNIFTARADYSQPFKKKASFAAGLKTSFVKNDNVFDYYNMENDVPKPDYGKSNHFIYHENINAAYASGRKDWKRWGMQVGLRFENTQIKGEQLGNVMVPGTEFTRSYNGLFPNFAILYKLDSMGKHTLNVEYTRRLNRPGYQQLNPFLFFRDQYTYSSGNPYLRPTYNNNVTVSYRFKQYINASLMYDRLHDQIIGATKAEGDLFVNRPENVTGGFMVALMLNSNTNPTKWWMLNAHAATARFLNEGEVDDVKFKYIQWAWRTNIINQFRFKKDWSAELGFNYNSKMINWQRRVDPRIRTMAAIQKKILKGKGSIKFNVEDIFFTAIMQGEIVSIKQASSTFYNQMDTRRFGIAFNYNFGKETFSRKRRYNDNSADDLKGRVD